MLLPIASRVCLLSSCLAYYAKKWEFWWQSRGRLPMWVALFLRALGKPHEIGWRPHYYSCREPVQYPAFLGIFVFRR